MYDALLYFTLVNLLDIISTKRALEKGAYEMNPIARKMLSIFGIKGLFILKYLLMGLILIGMPNEFGLWLSNAFISAVVTWNSVVLVKMTQKQDEEQS
jgi:hypothetical protein